MRLFADEQASAGVITHAQRASAPPPLPPPPHAETSHEPSAADRNTPRTSRAPVNDHARDSLLIELPVLKRQRPVGAIRLFATAINRMQVECRHEMPTRTPRAATTQRTSMKYRWICQPPVCTRGWQSLRTGRGPGRPLAPLLGFDSTRSDLRKPRALRDVRLVAEVPNAHDPALPHSMRTTSAGGEQPGSKYASAECHPQTRPRRNRSSLFTISVYRDQ
jgi:hypothetical protein